MNYFNTNFFGRLKIRLAERYYQGTVGRSAKREYPEAFPNTVVKRQTINDIKT